MRNIRVSMLVKILTIVAKIYNYVTEISDYLKTSGKLFVLIWQNKA